MTTDRRHLVTPAQHAEIHLLRALGKKEREIGAELGLKRTTVHYHLSRAKCWDEAPEWMRCVERALAAARTGACALAETHLLTAACLVGRSASEAAK